MEQFLIQNQWLILLVALWVLPWKGVALWKAARNSHRNWFIALLVINTLAILEILYIFIFSKRNISTKEYGENGEFSGK
ncbi:hypothetical protein KJ934_01845 [Patescibacteria group bacterium]|nr:hypothetical protein [Patescibacteria group bacterium]MBU4353214.1 hypothetical protein [Patescibacteria group bacterium]MBU4477110.1 hypothetical protein [Patescibacteria group bacterium]MCG2698961.1 DUF5652 family protein [Candidatus Parcubacteria bacterium]